MDTKSKNKNIISLSNISKVYKVKNRDEDEPFIKKIGHFFVPAYDNVYGVKDISFNIKEGEFVGLIGENGAGKSTTIKIMSGILTPTTGDVNILGYIPYKQRRKYTQNTGIVMGQKSLLWYNIPVVESLKLYKEIYKVRNNDFIERIEFFKKVFKADDILNKAVRQLSLGQRMRAELMASLIHKPKILFLDEPTIGLDVLSKNLLHDYLREINSIDKTTIILTSHDSNEIQKLCTRAIVLKKGKIINDCTMDSILTQEENLESYLIKIYKDEE